MITTPKFAEDKPSSIESVRLSPVFSVNLSYQTLTPNSDNAFARGSTKFNLSSEACEIKTSHCFMLVGLKFFIRPSRTTNIILFIGEANTQQACGKPSAACSSSQLN